MSPFSISYFSTTPTTLLLIQSSHPLFHRFLFLYSSFVSFYHIWSPDSLPPSISEIFPFSSTFIPPSCPFFMLFLHFHFHLCIFFLPFSVFPLIICLLSLRLLAFIHILCSYFLSLSPLLCLFLFLIFPSISFHPSFFHSCVCVCVCVCVLLTAADH